MLAWPEVSAMNRAKLRSTRSRLHTRRPSSSTLVGGGMAVLFAAVALQLVRRSITRISDRRDQRIDDQRGLDSLTGLPNRAEAIWWLNTRLQRAQSRSHRLALMVLDIDDFTEWRGCPRSAR